MTSPSRAVKTDRELIVELLDFLATQRKCEECVALRDATCHRHDKALRRWQDEAQRLVRTLPN